MATSVARSMPAPARSTNENAICVVANIRNRRLVPGVIRTLPLVSPRPAGAGGDGRRGTYGSRAAAGIARPGPIQRTLGLTVTSSARTEEPAALRAHLAAS